MGADAGGLLLDWLVLDGRLVPWSQSISVKVASNFIWRRAMLPHVERAKRTCDYCKVAGGP